MLIKTKNSYQLSEQQVTDEAVYHARRKVLKQLGFLGAGSLLAQSANASPLDFFSSKSKEVFQRQALNFQHAEKSTEILRCRSRRKLPQLSMLPKKWLEKMPSHSVVS